MPYISENDRQILDVTISHLVSKIYSTKYDIDKGYPKDFSKYLGAINYCFTRIITQVMMNVSYSNIAGATGVLENVKQELYRRMASKYEDQKINENGDIPEYKKWS